MSKTTVASRTSGRVRLLIDHWGDLERPLVERREGGKVILRGELGRADVVTSNRRLYPRAILEREIRRLREEAKARRLFGELDHPADGRTQYQRVSHRILDIWMEDDGRVMGEIEVIPTSKGKDLAAIAESGGAVGFSSRGTGTTHQREDGVDVVNDDYHMITYDAVADPAHAGAYPEVFFESKEAKNLGRVDMPELDALIEENPELGKEVEARIKAALEQERERIKAEVQEAAKSQLESQLLRHLSDLRKEVEENVRSEMASDPRWVDAKRRLEAVRSVLGVGEGGVAKEELERVQKALAERDEQIRCLTQQMEEIRKKLSEAEAAKEQMLRRARREAVERFVEKQASLSGNPSLFKKLVAGKISEEDSPEELNQKTKEVLGLMKELEGSSLGKVKEVSDLALQIREEVEKQVSGLQKKIGELEDANKRLRVALEKSLSIAKEGYTEALKRKVFEESVAATHPARSKILSLLEQAKLSKREEIERFIEEAVKGEKDSVLLEQVRSKVSRGEGRGTDSEGNERRSFLDQHRSGEPSLFGAPVSVLRKLAGIKG